MISLPDTPTWVDTTVVPEGAAPVGVRLYPAAARGVAKALVLHLHGGAFVGGSAAGSAAVAGLFNDAGAAVASVDYPLAPAHPFPHAAEAAFATLQWLDNQRRRLGAMQAPLFVAGEDAGGNLAAALALMARDRGGPALAGQMLLSPMLDACVGTASQRKAGNGPVGCPCADGWRAYLAQTADLFHPYAVPAASLRLAGLPPTLLVTAQDDPLRDETLAFARRLREAGVPVQAPVLAAPTGWPRSYAQTDAPWRAALAVLIHDFMFDTDTTRGSLS